jgi:hypothetical protein
VTSFSPNQRIRPGGVGTAGPAGDLSGLKTLVRTSLALNADDVVLVSELHCAEPGCPPVETVVVVLDEDGHRKWKIPLPPAEVTTHTLRQTLAAEPQGQKLTND